MPPAVYAPLGPQCPLLARKFPPETAQVVDRLLSDCKNRLKILFLDDCRRHVRRRMLAVDEPESDGDRQPEHAMRRDVPEDVWLALQALSSDALPDRVSLTEFEAGAQMAANASRDDDAGRRYVRLIADPYL